MSDPLATVPTVLMLESSARMLRLADFQHRRAVEIAIARGEVSQRKIAQAAGISRRTIARIKKEMHDAGR